MQTINLSLYKKTIIPVLWAKQQEVGRKFHVVFAEDIPEGVTFSVWYSGASGAGNYTKIGDDSAFHIDGNTVTVELIAQMLNNPGEGKLCLIMTGDDGLELGTWNIPYAVEAIPGLGSHPAEQYYQALRKLEEEAEAAAMKAAQSISAVCYTEQNLNEEQKAQARENIGAANSMMFGSIPNSTQTVTFNADGTIQKVLHKDGGGNVLRTDSYVYSGSTITETRTRASGETMTFVIDTSTLTMEVR